MASIKLTVNHLYRLCDGKKAAAQAIARVYVGDTLVATETVAGMTEAPVSKFLHHELPEGQPVRVEWEGEGNASMAAVEVERCPCCHPQDMDV